MMIPRAAVCADRIGEVLDTESSVVPPPTPVTDVAGRGALELRDVEFALPGRRARRCCATSRFTRARRARPPRSSAAPAPARPPGHLVPAAVRRHRRRGAGRRRRRPRARPGGALERGSAWCRRSRTCSPARSRATCATATRTPPTRSCGRRSRSPRPATSSSAMPERPRGADRPGRHQRLRRPAAAAGDRPGAGPPPEIYLFDDSFSALDLATDARLRAALRPGHRATPTVVIVAQRVSTIIDADQILVLEDGAVVGHRHPRRAARDLPDLPGDRRVPADRGGGGMSDARRTARRRPAGRPQPRPAGGRRVGRGPMGGDGHAGREVDDLRPVGQAAAAPAAPERGEVAGRRRCSPSSASCFAVAGPKILGHATDLIFAGVLGRQLPAGHHQAAGRRRGRAAAGHGNIADMLAGMRRRPRAGHRLRRPGARSCCWALGALRRGRRCSAGCRATCSTASCSAPSAGCAPTSRTSSTGCRCATSTGSRAASCSAGSPTTSTTSSQTPAADAEPAAHLAAHRRRRARR